MADYRPWSIGALRNHQISTPNDEMPTTQAESRQLISK
jgi:hypothetical protein